MADWSPIYSTGTASVGNGSTNVTGQGTNWNTAGLRAGDQFKAAGLSVSIASVNSPTSITLASSWPGTTRTTDDYEILRVSDADRLIAAHADLMAALVPNLTGFGALQGAANKLPYFSGPNALALADLTPAARAILALVGSAGAKLPVVTGTGAAALRDIVGTVSQSGGNPSGAILEQGSNANGIYTRYANGWQTCVSPDLTLTHVNASLVSNTWTFPASFLSGSDVAGGIGLPTAGSNYTAITLRDCGATVFNPQTSRASATVGVARIATATADAGATIINCRAFAEGRWV